MTYSKETISSIKKGPLFIAMTLMFILVLILVIPAVIYFVRAHNTARYNDTQFQETASAAFRNTLAQSGEYRLKGMLPSAIQVINRSKLNGMPITSTAGKIYMAVYQASGYKSTHNDAINLAQRFGITAEPVKKDIYGNPTWDSDTENLQSYGGGFEYYAKGSKQVGVAPSDDDATNIARDFLMQQGFIDDSCIVFGVDHNEGDISPKTGFWEDHKQVYFRRTLHGYPVYDWSTSRDTPIAEVWVGVRGRILRVNGSYPIASNTFDENNKTAYLIQEPASAFEDLKAGIGRLVEMPTISFGPEYPTGNFLSYGSLKDIEIEDVQFAYYNQIIRVGQSEQYKHIYQPIYLFKAHATLGWKDSYKMSPGEASSVGEIAAVTFIAPAVRQNFILTLGAVRDVEDSKRNVSLSWDRFPGTAKYNVYLLMEHDQVLLINGTNNLSYVATVPKHDDNFFIVQTCNTQTCYSSNVIFLPKQ